MPDLVSGAVPGPSVPDFDANAHLKTQLTISIYKKVLDGLKARFGNRLESSIDAILGCLLEPDSFIVPQSDAKRLSEHFGVPVHSSAELLGKVFETIGRRNELQASVDRLATAMQEGRRVSKDGSITLTLSPSDEDYLRQKAQFAGISIERTVENLLTYAIEQKWV